MFSIKRLISCLGAALIVATLILSMRRIENLKANPRAGTCNRDLLINNYELQFFKPGGMPPIQLLRPDRQNCFLVGETYSVKNYSGEIKYGSAKVEEVQYISASQLKDGWPNFDIYNFFLSLYEGSDWALSAVKRIKLSAIKWNKDLPEVFFEPINFSDTVGVQVVNREAVLQAAEKNLSIIDIREPEEYAKTGIKGSRNLPYLISPLIPRVELDPFNYLDYFQSAQEDDMLTESLPSAHVGEVFVIAGHTNDHRLLRFLYNISRRGGYFIKLHIVEESNNDLAFAETPNQAMDFKIINRTQVENLLREHALIVDVRTRFESVAEGSGGIFKNYPFYFSDVARDKIMQFLADSKKAQKLDLATDLDADVRRARVKHLVIVGRDQYDWRPVLAATLASHKLPGVKIYHYRNGVRDYAWSLALSADKTGE